MPDNERLTDYGNTPAMLSEIIAALQKIYEEHGDMYVHADIDYDFISSVTYHPGTVNDYTIQHGPLVTLENYA